MVGTSGLEGGRFLPFHSVILSPNHVDVNRILWQFIGEGLGFKRVETGESAMAAHGPVGARS